MAVVGGHTSVLLVNVLSVVPHVDSGRLHALAVTSLQRVDALKDVATVFDAFLRGEMQRNEKIARAVGLKIDCAIISAGRRRRVAPPLRRR